MIPDYLTFIRYQDKRLIPFIYLILGVLWGFYWKNRGYSLTQQDAEAVCAIMAIVFFHLIYDLKAYWMYKAAAKNVDFSCFSGKKLCWLERWLSRPLVATALAALVCWTLVRGGLALSESKVTLLGLYSLLPYVLYLAFRGVRAIYIKQLANVGRGEAPLRRLRDYVSFLVLVNCVLNILTVSPLKNNPDFSLSSGWLTPALMVAMFILCLTVLTLNLLFAQLSRKYVFLGKFFLQEIDFSFSTAIPCAALHAQPLAARLFFWAILQMLWIMLIGALLTLLSWNLPFSLYFFFCAMPTNGYYFLHLYWLRHTDFLTACDMYLRSIEIDKRESLW